MNAYADSYPSLQRRLIASRRSRAFFSPRSTRHVRSVARPRPRARASRVSLAGEIGRAAAALASLLAWSAALIFFFG
jgi:hypothetical protein